jgi:hypothetical protein
MEKDYLYALIAIVLIVAIVGAVSIAVNYQPRISTGITTTASSALVGQAGLTKTPPATCIDTDGGLNWYTRGATYKGTGNKTDYCVIGSSTLVEYYCKSNTITSKNYNCASLTEGKICVGGACVTPQCTAGQTKNCIDNNGCNGINACNNNFWGPCTSTQFYCDANCDGNNECSNSQCQTCTCINGNTRDCTDANGCQGWQNCTGGIWTTCLQTKYFCDSNCDGTKECNTVNCNACACTNGEIRACTATSGCVGVQICTNGAWGSCAVSGNRSEVDTCFFGGTGNWTNYCYSNKGQNCTGYSQCAVGVSGSCGEKLTWTSNCYGNPITTIDGTNEYAFFNCTISH